MHKIIIPAVILSTLCSPAWAVSKCRGSDGKVTYQDAPCESAEKLNLTGAGQATPNSQGGNYWKREVARQAHNEKVESAISTRQVFLGMTAEEARRSWGSPSKINTSSGSYGTHEQWVFDRGNFRSQYIYIQNGLVTSTQSQE